MNKRARLARRILREHRRGMTYHIARSYCSSGGLDVWSFWSCPHCTHASILIPSEVPIAYR